MIYKIALWIDDIRPVPTNYMEDYGVNRVIWCHSTNEAISTWLLWETLSVNEKIKITRIDLDHDAGDYVNDGGDFINFLNWLELAQVDMTKVKWHIHSFNPVGRENMRRIIERNGAYCV